MKIELEENAMKSLIMHNFDGKGSWVSIVDLELEYFEKLHVNNIKFFYENPINLVLYRVTSKHVLKSNTYKLINLLKDKVNQRNV